MRVPNDRLETIAARPPLPFPDRLRSFDHRTARVGRSLASRPSRPISRHHSMGRTARIHAAQALSDTCRPCRPTTRRRAVGKPAIPHGC
jgi:hypothetical protein